MKLKILESARRDLRRGYDFYEAQQVGIGDYFLDTLTAEIGALVLHAGIHPSKGGYHRVISRTFPYAIYYRMKADEVVVHAVLDCREHPGKLKRRLR